jgi:hypothetical protein
MTTQTTPAYYVPNSASSQRIVDVVPYQGTNPTAPPTMDDLSYYYTPSPAHSTTVASFAEPTREFTPYQSEQRMTTVPAPPALSNQQQKQINMKEKRKRIQAAAAVTGAVSGFFVAGPLGSVVLGCTSHLVTKQVCKKRERRILDKKYDQAIAQPQEFSDDAVFT